MKLIELCQYTISNSLQDMNWPLEEPTAEEIVEEDNETI